MTLAHTLLTDQPRIRFHGQVEYRIDGDYADLRADLAILDAQLINEQPCALQLWACATPSDAPLLNGTKVAEVQLSSAAGQSRIEQQALALLPAGQYDYTMVMALVGQDALGRPQLHDYTLFDNRQLFSQPSLQGEVQCRLHADSVDLSITAIRNPRPLENLSGSLSLELWALNAPYSGGAFSGFELARAELGTLAGGSDWRDTHFNLSLAQPPVGEWQLVLMLREWTPAGYLTRDFRQLQELVQAPAPSVEALPVEALPVETQSAAAQPVDVQPVEAQPVEAQPVAVPPVAPAAAPSASKAKATSAKAAASNSAASKPAVTKPVAAKPASAPKTKAAAPAKAQPAAGAVSVNEASAKELSAVKGLSTRLADAIVANRPYASLDELLKVRGMGARMLAKLRDLLRL